jgi:hypothetical protein
MRATNKHKSRQMAAALALLFFGGVQALHAQQQTHTPGHEAATAYAQALQALQQQQWTQAELLLERVLMFQPENAEAMVQLAQLLAQRGRAESAQAIIQALLQDARTPGPQRERLQALLVNTAAAANHRAEPTPLQKPARQWAEWTLGRGSNPLVTTQARDITLTLPGGNLTLPLAESAQAGSYLSAWLARLSSQGTLLQAQVQGVDLAQARTAVRLSAQGPMPLPGAPTGVWQWQAQTQRQADGTQRHQAGLVYQQGAYQWQAGAYSEPQATRRGPYARALRHWALPQGHQIQAWADLEANHGEGAPSLVRLGGQAALALGSHWQWQSQVQVHHDLAGYSALLENNKKRNILTFSTALEYQFAPLAPQGWALRVYGAQRWSNIPLFAWKDAGAQLVWRSAW